MKKYKNIISFFLIFILIFALPTVTFGLNTGLQNTAENIRDYTFLDDNSENKDFSFLYFGDVQFVDDMKAEYAVFGKMLQEAYNKNNDISFVLSSGDMVNWGQTEGQWQSFFDNTLGVLSKVPFFATAGNHESNALSGKPEMMLEIFNFPHNGPAGFDEEFYSFDYGKCHITVLNSCVFMGEQQIDEAGFTKVNQWLINDLQSSNKEFKIVVTHHPPYSIGNDTTCDLVKTKWCPIFEKYGVDLVLSGHQHAYMRTNEINGVTYLISNSGQKYYQAVDTSQAAVYYAGISCYQILKVIDNKLILTTYDANHQVIDQWQKVSETQNVSSAKGQQVKFIFSVLRDTMKLIF